MEILGKDFINFKPLIYVKNIEDLKSGVLFDYNESFIKLANEKDFEFSVIIENQYQALFANAAKAKYLIVGKNYRGYVRDLTELAEFYLFDAKVSLLCKDDERDEQSLGMAIDFHVDCVIFDKGIIWK